MYRWTKPFQPQDPSHFLPIIFVRKTQIRREEKLSFAVAAERFDELCKWISSLGLNTTNTRIHRYQRILKYLANIEPARIYVDFLKKYDLHHLTNTTFEANELLRIHEGLKTTTHPELKARLKRVLSGPEMFGRGDSSGARDFSLELDVLARFAKADIPIDHGHIADLARIWTVSQFSPNAND